MKSLLIVPALLLSSFVQAYTLPLIGTDKSSIIAELGEPDGTVAMRDKQLLLYPQGEITIQNGQAIKVNMMAEAAFIAHQAKLKIERAEWAERSALLAAANQAQGEQIKATKLNSAAFAQLPARNQLAFWNEFQFAYPNVDVRTQVSDADDVYQAELAEMRAKEELSQLKAQIAEAEKATAEAELEAQKLRNALNRRPQYGLRYYTDPVIQRHVYYPRQKVTVYSNGKTHRSNNYCWDLRQHQTTASRHQLSLSNSSGSFRLLVK